MIEISGVNKKLDQKTILRDINLNINDGSIFGLIGPNGAGKTTLIKCMTGIYRTDTGSIKVDGETVFENRELKKKIAYVASDNDYFFGFSVNDMINFYIKAFDTFDIDMFSRINKMFDVPRANSVSKLSKGNKMKLSIMLNVCINPEILILDEPTNGLDPIAKKQLLNLLVEYAAEKKATIFISSHSINELERICDSVGIISNGKILHSDLIENMKKNIRNIQVVFKEETPKEIEDWPEVLKVERRGRVCNIITRAYSEEFIKKLEALEVMFHEEVDLSLEDIFIYTVGKSAEYKSIFDTGRKHEEIF